MIIEQSINQILTGQRRQPVTEWVVTGTNSRGWEFEITYRTLDAEHSAKDYAAEIRAKGGTATARRA